MNWLADVVARWPLGLYLLGRRRRFPQRQAKIVFNRWLVQFGDDPLTVGRLGHGARSGLSMLRRSAAVDWQSWWIVSPHLHAQLVLVQQGRLAVYAGACGSVAVSASGARRPGLWHVRSQSAQHRPVPAPCSWTRVGSGPARKHRRRTFRDDHIDDANAEPSCSAAPHERPWRRASR